MAAPAPDAALVDGASDCAPTDVGAARGRQVRAAVAALVEGLGSEGATLRRHVEAWEGALAPGAPKLAALPTLLKMAAQGRHREGAVAAAYPGTDRWGKGPTAARYGMP